MEEEKAAVYYNELLGKGRNAALFKQGLGFGGEGANAPAAKHGMINFIGAGKSADAGKPAKFGSEERDAKDNKDGSRSPSKRKRGRRRSRSREPKGGSPRDERRHRYRRDRRSRSRSRSRDRSRRHRRVWKCRSRSRSRERSRRGARSESGSPGRRGLDDARRDRSRSDRRQESSRRQKGSGRRMEFDQDWPKLIPGFDSMTPAEKVKAKMKLQLSQTVVKDAGKGVEEEWERFDFNKDAPLDGDAKQDYFGDGTGASTDTAQIDNLGGSHLFVTEQAKREARLQAAHEAAIFGAPVVVKDKDVKRRSTRRERESSAFRRVDDDRYEDGKDPAAAEVSGVVSEQIIALQAGSSWQERIKKMRAAQAQDES